jgi:Ran GTPase-activating protein (RanGAP) involved in mRNA processing and transport
MAVSEDVLAMTFSERHANTINIDGQLMDSATIAGVLREAKNRPQVREMTLRNVQIDETVAKGIDDLFQTNKAWTKVESIHCSGMLSRVIQASIPWTQQFLFTGNVPIAHNPRYGLDDDSLKAIGEELERDNIDNANANANVATITGITAGHTALTTLSLKGSRLAEEGFRRFCEGLAQSATLETLQMSCCALENEDVILLASALRRNKHLKSFSLADCRFGSLSRSIPPSNASASTSSSESEVDVEEEEEETFTQSTNNTSPQSHFPLVLEALAHHPTLESLNVYGMFCNDQSMEALGEMLKSQETKLWHLGLKNNIRHPEGKVNVRPILQALRQNTSLTYLKLTGANFNDEDVDTLSSILAESNWTLRGLSITDNAIGDQGLLAFASRMSNMKGLRYLDVQRNPITDRSKNAMVAALEDNVELERLDLDGSWDPNKSRWLCLNRGGRRLLQDSDNVRPSLWPLILDRAYKMQFGRNQSAANFDVVYYMIRRLPSLFETASFTITEEIDGSKRKRRHDLIVSNDADVEDSEEAEPPKSKRKSSIER